MPTSSAAARDADLVDLLREGNTAHALDLLLQRYERKIYRLCLAYLCDSSAAEDCTQDSLVRLWRGLASYDANKASLSTWVYAVTRNRCLSLLARRREATLELDDPDIQHQLIEQRGESTLAATLANDALQRLIAMLPDAQRHALRLYYFEEQSVTQAAHALGLPEGTLKTHLHRARAALRLAMRDAGLDDPDLWL